MKKILPIIFIVSTLVASCTDAEESRAMQVVLQMQNDSLKTVIEEQAAATDQKILTFLTFQKEDAEQAMNFYISLFDNSEIVTLNRWGKDMPGKEGTVMQGTFTLNGQLYMCSDSPPIHEWDFTPAVSNYVDCEDEAELERLFLAFSAEGEVMMPLGNYGFSQQFGWVVDQFGISWQLNLP